MDVEVSEVSVPVPEVVAPVVVAETKEQVAIVPVVEAVVPPVEVEEVATTVVVPEEEVTTVQPTGSFL